MKDKENNEFFGVHDVDIRTSLFEYGLICAERENDFLFIAGTTFNYETERGYQSFDWFTIQKDADIKEEYDWADWEEVINFVGNNKGDWDKTGIPYKMADFISYYGYGNVHDCYNPMTLQELIRRYPVLNDELREDVRCYYCDEVKPYDRKCFCRDPYTVIYFDLWADEEEDQSIEAEEKAVQEALAVLAPITDGFGNEGHDDIYLCLKFGLEKSRIPELQELIRANSGSFDDDIFLESGLQIGHFEIVDNPGTGPSVSFDEWDDYLAED